MKVILAALLLMVGVVACGRRVEVETGTPPAPGASLQVTNNANQPVNVYVTSGGNELFLGQVAPNSTQLLPVSGVASGSSVTLRARTADGAETYTREYVTLSGTFTWQVP